jgi:hypothetical protein
LGHGIEERRSGAAQAAPWPVLRSSLVRDVVEAIGEQHSQGRVLQGIEVYGAEVVPEITIRYSPHQPGMPHNHIAGYQGYVPAGGDPRWASQVRAELLSNTGFKLRCYMTRESWY